MSSKLRGSAYIVSALGVLACTGLPATVLAGPVLSPSLAAPPYTVAASCDLAKPLVVINLIVRNAGDAPTFPMPVSINDAGGAFTGGSMLPRLEPGTQSALQVPLSHAASSPGAVGGNHVVTVAIGSQPMRPVQVSVPATLCTGKPPAATPTPASMPIPTPSAAPATMTGVHGSRTKRATPQPAVANIGDKASSRAAIIASLKLAVPSNLHSISDHGAECLPHVGALGTLICPDMIRSGDLLLVWDWQPGGGPDDIDGFRVYRVDGGRKQLTYTRADKKDLTLVDLPKPPDGYARKCYAVSAYAAKQESDLSAPFCATGGSVATTTRLSADYVRSSFQSSYNGGGALSTTGSDAVSGNGVQVGFSYVSEKLLVQDSHRNMITRGGIHFDVAKFANRRLVSAKLTLTIASSEGEGNNRSCASDLGTGREFWWLNKSWLDASFDLPNHAPGADIGLGDAGPQIPVDVTQTVASWLRGNPNYGFVLKNSGENLNAFTNHKCLTTYSNPILEITYY